MRTGAAATVVAGALMLTGCASGDATNSRGSGDVPTTVSGTVTPPLVGVEPLPSEHVHGVAINPADGLVYLATHNGIFVAEGGGWAARGPVIDLMGFSVAGPDHFYASGHPGQGTQLPNPVGLIESRDAGRTWTPMSRQGQSDFHALTARPNRFVGFDGQLRVSRDGAGWATTPGLPASAFSLAGGEGDVVMATTERGVALSQDGGMGWDLIDGAPLLLLVDWVADQTFVGVAPDGVTHVSEDGGRTWQRRGQVAGQPQALGATEAGSELRILVVVETSVQESRDGGRTFSELQL